MESQLARVYAIIALVMFTLTVLALCIVNIQLRRLKRERHRLDRALNKYNRAFNDDFDYFNGYNV